MQILVKLAHFSAPRGILNTLEVYDFLIAYPVQSGNEIAHKQALVLLCPFHYMSELEIVPLKPTAEYPFFKEDFAVLIILCGDALCCFRSVCVLRKYHNSLCIVKKGRYFLVNKRNVLVYTVKLVPLSELFNIAGEVSPYDIRLFTANRLGKLFYFVRKSVAVGDGFNCRCNFKLVNAVGTALCFRVKI